MITPGSILDTVNRLPRLPTHGEKTNFAIDALAESQRPPSAMRLRWEKRQARHMELADAISARIAALPADVCAGHRVCRVAVGFATRDLLAPAALDGSFAVSARLRDALEKLAGTGKVLVLLPVGNASRERTLPGDVVCRSIRALIEFYLDEAVSMADAYALQVATELADFLLRITAP